MNRIGYVKIYSAMKCMLTALVFIAASSAQAALINFDDLDHDGDPVFYSNPLTDQYQQQGLLIDDGYLLQYWEDDEALVSSPNYLLGGHFLQLIFMDPYPTFVSMYVSTHRQDVVYLNATTAAGSVVSRQTLGWAGPFDDTPYTPRQLITFALEEGIKTISVTSFYSTRTSAMIDDLVFETARVPESSSLLLLLTGLLGLTLRNRKASE